MSKAFRFPSDPARSTVLVSGLRTPFLRAGTNFSRLSAADLSVHVLRELISRNDLAPSQVDELIFGCVAPGTKEMNVARVAALRAGLPTGMPAYTVSRNCASGLQSIEEASRRIAAGEGDCYLVGGSESMSSYPLQFNERFKAWITRFMRTRSRWKKFWAVLHFRPSFLVPRVALLEGLTDPVCGLLMGLTAENLVNEFGISRRDQDLYALESHQRALQGRQQGFFEEEVMSVFAGPAAEECKLDNGPRKGLSLEALQRLHPYFDRREGTVTVGNACPVSDGAVALLLMSEERAKAEGRSTLGRLVASSVAGLDPSRMGLGPAHAIPPALAAAGLQHEDIDRWEVNEAFAAQVLACQAALDSKRFCVKELGLSAAFGRLDPARLNTRGGAVALGHPVGATGARIVLTLLRQLEADGQQRGVASLCVGGGQGAAQVWEAA